MVTTPAPRNKPVSVPNSSQLPRKPRRLPGAYSAMNVAAPPYSPPAEKPCTGRARTTRTRASTPTVSHEGNRPMAKVERTSG